MPRYKLTIEFDGTGLVGWQRQDNGPSVQQAIEDACAKFAHQEVRLHTAGRTDAGVHALGMVAHFDMEMDMPVRKLQQAINHHVKPYRVSVLEVEVVDETFHARFECLERSYLYRILCRSARPTLDMGRVWWHQQQLDPQAMHIAAQCLIGNHDFSSFRAIKCQSNSPIRTLDEVSVEQVGAEIHIRVRARSFLHHQVRNIVGTLAMVGKGKWTAQDVKDILEAKDRRRGGETAPACGLYFVEARY
jgi:tRNA pseudouridine38-40 synthase